MSNPPVITNRPPMRFNVIMDFKPEGSLVFYTIRSITELTPDPINQVYWKDAQSPQGYGPFYSLWEACEHHKALVKKMKTEEIKPDCQVIQYNFRDKKRL